MPSRNQAVFLAEAVGGVLDVRSDVALFFCPTGRQFDRTVLTLWSGHVGGACPWCPSPSLWRSTTKVGRNRITAPSRVRTSAQSKAHLKE